MKLHARKMSVFLAAASVAGLSSMSRAESLSFTSTGFNANSKAYMVLADGSPLWSGGAAGVQGPGSYNNLSTFAVAANTVLRFDIGATMDLMNSTYGVGGWTVTDATLSFQYTLYANNSRFGAGAGTFDTYWISEDASTNLQFSDNEADLSIWTGNSLLAGEYFDWTTPNYTGTYSDLGTSAWVTDKVGDRQSIMSFDLTIDAAFAADITAASASGNNIVTLYLMETSDTVGICIFTGGSVSGGNGGGSSISIDPTLSFTVAAIPEPASLMLLSLGGLCVIRNRRRDA